MPFQPVGDLSGNPPFILNHKYTVKTANNPKFGQPLTLSSGELAVAATGNAICGWSAGNYSAGDTDAQIYPVTTIMQTVDGNARTLADPLDLATGAQGVTTHSNDDLVVYESKPATEDTLVIVHPAKTPYMVAT